METERALLGILRVPLAAALTAKKYTVNGDCLLNVITTQTTKTVESTTKQSLDLVHYESQ